MAGSCSQVKGRRGDALHRVVASRTLDSSRAPQSDPHLIEQLILSGKTEPRTEISDHGTQRSSSRTEGEKNPGMLEYD